MRDVTPRLNPAPVVGRYGPFAASAYYRVAVPLSVIGGAWAPIGPAGAKLLDAARVVVLQRVGGEPAFVRAAIDDLRRLGKRVFVDYDDDPDAIPSMRTPGWHGLMAALRHADAVVCTSEVLAARLRRHNPDVRVVPNYVRADWWPSTASPPTSGPLRLVLAGGGSHAADWRIIVEPLRRVRRARPGAVTLRVCGPLPDALRGVCDEHRPWAPLRDYPAMIAGAHVGLCPLPDSTFNRGKSPIKAYEYALAGLAVIGSPTQYGPVLAEGRGAVADSPDAWEAAIIRYLDDPDARRREASALRAHVTTALDARRHAATIRAAYAA